MRHANGMPVRTTRGDRNAKVLWLRSYITDDKMYCVYIGPEAKTIKEHARKGGFPADVVSCVRTIIDPTTAEAAANG
jgi:predicted 2-oxoglutarate/Fe(II)-dependent dioxygenase YbiX